MHIPITPQEFGNANFIVIYLQEHMCFEKIHSKNGLLSTAAVPSVSSDKLVSTVSKICGEFVLHYMHGVLHAIQEMSGVRPIFQTLPANTRTTLLLKNGVPT